MVRIRIYICTCTELYYNSETPINVCELPKDSGPCRAAFPRWFFDTSSGKCQRFTFGGCQGNRNNFETLEECLNTCGELMHSIKITIKQHGVIRDSGFTLNSFLE